MLPSHIRVRSKKLLSTEESGEETPEENINYIHDKEERKNLLDGTGEADTVPEFRFNWYTVDTTDGYYEGPPITTVPTKTITRPPAQPPAPTPVQPATVITKPPKASTSARARLPSSTTSSKFSSS